MFWFGKKKQEAVEDNQLKTEEKKSFWNADYSIKKDSNENLLDVLRNLVNQNNQVFEKASGEYAMDGSTFDGLNMRVSAPNAINEHLSNWFASQSFIGYQMCAILAQNWLIRKACYTPSRDATRNGYDIVSTNGDEIPTAVIKKLERFDKKFKIKLNAEQFISMGRIFGIRLAFFDIDSDDPEFYEKPFNLDGVGKGAYRGVIQVDPYWCVPELVGAELFNPASQHFYEPTYWRINNKRIHRSHLIIFRNGDVPDILKPMYLYGGVPVPQLIMERVYGSERTASEALGLVTSKRTNVWLTDMEAFITNADKATKRLGEWISYRDNYGLKLGDKDDDQFLQFDTTLSELDNVIMTQYQLVAAAANVPATKLLGTSPKGFNSTGEDEEENYSQELKSIQEHDLTELIERHHELVIKSYCDEQVEVSINWRPTDNPTAKKLAERNNLKAQTYSSLAMAGAIDGEDIRFRLANDPDSGFHDMGEKESALNDLGLTPEDIKALKALDDENKQAENADEDDRGQAITV